MNTFCQGGWKAILSAAIAANLVKRIRLFKNDYTPLNTDVTANYTEADFNGYAGYTNLAWGAPFINGSTEGEADATPITWTKAAGGTSNTVYGIYVTDAADVLTYAERFPAPQVMTGTGATITYTAKVTDVNQ